MNLLCFLDYIVSSRVAGGGGGGVGRSYGGFIFLSPSTEDGVCPLPVAAGYLLTGDTQPQKPPIGVMSLHACPRREATAFSMLLQLEWSFGGPHLKFKELAV